MRKAIFILTCTLLISSFCNAGSKYGLIAGVSNATFIKKDVTTGSDYILIKMPYSDYGIHAGLFYQLKLGIFILEPELYLSTISNTYKINQTFESAETVYKNDRSFNAELPLLLGLKISAVKFLIGPSARLMMTKLNNVEEYTGYEVRMNQLLWSIQAGIGFEIKRFQLNFKYEFGLSNVTDGVVIDGYKHNFDTRSNQIIVNIGWELK